MSTTFRILFAAVLAVGTVTLPPLGPRAVLLRSEPVLDGEADAT